MTAKTQLVRGDDHNEDRAEIVPWNESQVDALRKVVATDLSEPEFLVFAEVCRTSGLNPFARQIYAIKRQGKMTIQTGVDGFRLIAARTGLHVGTTDPEYDAEDSENPNRATVTVYRLSPTGEKIAYTATARWSEYVQLKDGRPHLMWAKMPYLMLGKCAECLALRKAFPGEMSGIYSDDEMDQADNNTARQRRNANARGDATVRKVHPSWNADEAERFEARVAALWEMDGLRAWLRTQNRPQPEEMTQERRDELLDYLQKQHAKRAAIAAQAETSEAIAAQNANAEPPMGGRD